MSAAISLPPLTDEANRHTPSASQPGSAAAASNATRIAVNANRPDPVLCIGVTRLDQALGSRPPVHSPGVLLADARDALAEQVGMPVMAGVILDHVHLVWAGCGLVSGDGPPGVTLPPGGR
jgi:hypothetical protein